MFDLQMSVTDWESYFLNRANTNEITPRVGFVTKISYLRGWVGALNLGEQQEIYSRLVQAVLNQWEPLSSVERNFGKTNPTFDVADLAFDAERKLRPHLESQYRRLWQESPRPHGKELHWIALNSGGELPVSRAEIGLIFELKGWGLIALRLAAKKGYINDAIDLLDELEKRSEEISPSHIDSLVKSGFPKERGMRWLKKYHSKDKYAERLIDRWSKEVAK